MSWMVLIAFITGFALGWMCRKIYRYLRYEHPFKPDRPNLKHYTRRELKRELEKHKN